MAGSLSVSVADSCYITCSKTGLKVILEYQEEGWLGRSQNKVHGVIFKYDKNNDNITKIKDVSDKDVLGRIEGCWQDKVYYTLGNKPFSKVSVSGCMAFFGGKSFLIMYRRNTSLLTSTRSTHCPNRFPRSTNNCPMNRSSFGNR